MKIRSVGAALIQADIETDGRIGTTRLIGTFRENSKVPKTVLDYMTNASRSWPPQVYSLSNPTAASPSRLIKYEGY
jgi:hypothetical protein